MEIQDLISSIEELTPETLRVARGFGNHGRVELVPWKSGDRFTTKYADDLPATEWCNVAKFSAPTFCSLCNCTIYEGLVKPWPACIECSTTYEVKSQAMYIAVGHGSIKDWAEPEGEAAEEVYNAAKAKLSAQFLSATFRSKKSDECYKQMSLEEVTQYGHQKLNGWPGAKAFAGLVKIPNLEYDSDHHRELDDIIIGYGDDSSVRTPSAASSVTTPSDLCAPEYYHYNDHQEHRAPWVDEEWPFVPEQREIDDDLVVHVQEGFNTLEDDEASSEGEHAEEHAQVATPYGPIRLTGGGAQTNVPVCEACGHGVYSHPYTDAVAIKEWIHSETHASYMNDERSSIEIYCVHRAEGWACDAVLSNVTTFFMLENDFYKCKHMRAAYVEQVENWRHILPVYATLNGEKVIFSAISLEAVLQSIEAWSTTPPN